MSPKAIQRVVVVISLAYASIALACPMCKDSIPNSDADSAAGLPGGFNYSVYYMLLSLFAVMGFIGVVIVKNIRSTNRKM